MTSFVANTSSIGHALQTVVAVAVAAIFIMAIVSFLLAIWEFVRSEGEEESKKKGWNRIRFMMIGILLTIFFLFAFPLLVKYLGIEGYELFNAQNIFARIGELMNQILNVGSEAKNYYTQNGSFDLKNSMDTTSQSVDYTL